MSDDLSNKCCDKVGDSSSSKSTKGFGLNPFSNLASNFRRASSHLNLSDAASSSTSKKHGDTCDTQIDPSEANCSSPKKRSKWIMKFNCVKLKCIKNSIASTINSDSSLPKQDDTKNCNCSCSQRKLEPEQENLPENVASCSRLNSPEPTKRVLEKDGKGRRASEPLYGSVAALNEGGEHLDQGESSIGEPSESTSTATQGDKWVQIIYPSENTDVEEEDESDEFVRHSSAPTIQQGSIMITQHICGRNSSNHSEKRCFQLICPTEINVDTLRNLLQSYFTVDSVSRCHTQVDYIHYLVPDLRQITSCSFYWGKMDRYEAERLLEGKPEGTFLLRDSAQEEFLFSVSFRKYGRSLHARIEQFNHKFSFDSHDPGVYASDTVCGLIEHYKDPTCCMFFEPILTLPLHRNFAFSLQHLTRSIIASRLSYDTVDLLELPNVFKMYLKEYHYRQKVCVKRFDLGEVQCVDL